MQWHCYLNMSTIAICSKESRVEVYDLQITLQSAEKKRSNLFSNDYSCPQSIESPAPSNWRTKKKSRGKKGENDMPQKYSYHNDGQRGIHSCVIHQSTAMYPFLHTYIPAFVGKCSESLWSARWKKRTGKAERVFAGFEGALGRKNVR